MLCASLCMNTQPPEFWSSLPPGLYHAADPSLSPSIPPKGCVSAVIMLNRNPTPGERMNRWMS